MKQPKLKPDQRWRPNRGPWRHINGIDGDSGEIHFDDVKGYHWCYDADFQNWIERTKAKLVKRRKP